MFEKEQSQALLTLLEWEFAKNYSGTDDEMLDRSNDWISGLTDEEVAKICVDVFRNGI